MSTACRGGYQGGYTGLGTRVGIAGWVWGGLYRVPSQLPARRSHRQRSGPRSPCRGRSGWSVGPGAPELARTTPAGPGRSPLVPSLSWQPLPGNTRLLANKARFKVKTCKVSRNGEVSPKYVEKASHSPYLPKRVQKSPLDILQISISASLLSQGINGPFLTGRRGKVSK